jgi:MFS family permease
MFCCILAAVGALMVIFTQGSLVLSVVGLAVLGIGQSSATPLFFTATSEVISPKIAAGGIALVSSLGNLGPAVMPSVVSAVNTATGTPVASLYLVAGLWLVAGLILMACVKARTAVRPALAPA